MGFRVLPPPPRLAKEEMQFQPLEEIGEISEPPPNPPPFSCHFSFLSRKNSAGYDGGHGVEPPLGAAIERDGDSLGGGTDTAVLLGGVTGGSPHSWDPRPTDEMVEVGGGLKC